MYTNIDTTHALEVLKVILPSHILSALELIMRFNIFQFSDLYFRQKNGTAMGTPPACMWATLYFAQHEERLYDKYSHRLSFFGRYIDDGFGIWNWTGTQACHDDWTNFQTEMNDFGTLEWEFDLLKNTVNYLDLTLSL
jgi:hypothetical protein